MKFPESWMNICEYQGNGEFTTFFGGNNFQVYSEIFVLTTLNNIGVQNGRKKREIFSFCEDIPARL